MTLLFQRIIALPDDLKWQQLTYFNIAELLSLISMYGFYTKDKAPNKLIVEDLRIAEKLREIKASARNAPGKKMTWYYLYIALQSLYNVDIVYNQTWGSIFCKSLDNALIF